MMLNYVIIIQTIYCCVMNTTNKYEFDMLYCADVFRSLIYVKLCDMLYFVDVVYVVYSVDMYKNTNKMLSYANPIYIYTK